MPRHIAIVILNWNGSKFLRQFIPILLKHSGTHKIFVADNCSGDDSIDFLKTNHPEVETILLDKNYGFAEGYNRALNQIDAEFYVLLNSDVEVTHGWLEPLIRILERDLNVAAVQPKIKSFYQRTHFEYAGAAGGYIDWLGYPFCRGRIFDTLEIDHGQYDQQEKVFWASGACMAIRSSDFHNSGGFDPHFFAHMEEIDLCWRIQSAGKEIIYCPESTVYHVGGGTLPSGSPRKLFLNYRNGLIMLFKNTRAMFLIQVMLIRLILDGISAIRETLKGYPQNLFIILKAHLHFYKALPSIKRTPEKIPLNTVFNSSIVFQYYIRGRKRFEKLSWELKDQ